MLDGRLFVLFLAAATLLAVTPGPGIFYVLTRTLAGGRREGVLSALGTLAGGLVHVVAAGLGLSAVLAASAAASWKNGEYKKQPAGVITAARILTIAASGPLDLQARAPAREAADGLLEEISAGWARSDANDFLYQLDCSRTYNPEPDLQRIRARLIAINAADDFINPPELGIMQSAIKRVKNGRYVLLPLTGRGHRTVGDPSLWKKYLEELLQAPR
ncbi:MAG: LysE family transporter [Terriglobales bacterium]